MSDQEQQDHQLMWMDEEATEQAHAAQDECDGDKLAQLEAELQRTRQELSDVRKDLAAKVPAC